MTFTPNPKPSRKAGAKPKKPSTFKKGARKMTAPAPVSGSLKVGDTVSGSIKGTIIAVSGQTKGALIQAMLKAPEGATSKQIEAATGWAPHSVRGYLGTLRKAMVNVTSTKLKGLPTVYRIEPFSSDAEVL